MCTRSKGFQPTRPLRGATLHQRASPTSTLISTHAPLAGRDYSCSVILSNSCISTHAPLAGRDGGVAVWILSPTNFNPRAPCGARPPPTQSGRRSVFRFQPTRPLRGATFQPVKRNCLLYFNPRAPCGARRRIARMVFVCHFISTHAPLAGRDGRTPEYVALPCDFNPRAPCGARQRRSKSVVVKPYFNPRAPCGARRYTVDEGMQQAKISTHAPLAGRDLIHDFKRHALDDFNPRAPCGARPHGSQPCKMSLTFQPTRPLRGATLSVFSPERSKRFQPTRPLRGATLRFIVVCGIKKYFNPRAPCGARQASCRSSGL